jgi:hypothetical protein
MIQLARPALSAGAIQQLLQYQAVVDNQPGFPAKSAFAKKDFPLKNKIGNKAFDEVKAKLLKMSSGAERCHYCEDSKADEVEHILPKDAYPEFCYSWGNYVYACGSCNRCKSHYCAVIDAAGTVIEWTPPKTPKGSQPVLPVALPAGIFAIVDPVKENPLDFFFLDISSGSFELTEFPNPDSIEYKRAKFTLEVLKLGSKAFLRKARAQAYGNYKARLKEYIAERDSGVGQVILNKMAAELLSESHPTVWQEMKRQKDFVPEIQALFAQAPEALTW